MSQQYDYPLPPPPPSPRAGGTSPSAGSFSRHSGSVEVAHGDSHGQGHSPVSVHLPSITTTFLHEQGSLASQASTPVTETHLSPHFSYNSPRGPTGVNPPNSNGSNSSASPRVPVMEPYNPRQWGFRGQVSGSQMVFQQRFATVPARTTHVTGMEAAMPSPPPPYSPVPGAIEHASRAAMVSPMLHDGPLTASPSADRPLSNSPQVHSSPAFPPPPPQSSRHRERSASGLGQRSLFSLSGLRGKQPVAPEPQQPQPSSSFHVSSYVDARPPAARRAASTGHMQPSTSFASPSQTVGRTSPENRWQPGMALPGPPPGLPANGVRSQSLNRPIGPPIPSSTAIEPRQRRAVATPTLGPVPPTPADWVERNENSTEPELPHPSQASDTLADYQPLRIDTGANSEISLSRRPARRNTSTQGIRERRSRSRAALNTADEDSRPANLVFSTEAGAISRRREHNRTVSGHPGPSSASSPLAQPPLSASRMANNVLTPPYTPAVGKQSLGSANQLITKVPGSASSDRPVSNTLHTPNEENSTQAPTSPSRPASSGSTKAPQKLDAFALHAIERHRAFLEKEIAATTDEERLELFADFVVHESRVRRDRYTAAYNAMAGEILDLTRDMWRSYNSRSGRRTITPSTSLSSIDPSMSAWASDTHPRSASSLGAFTPATDTASDLGDGGDREARQWADSFKPSLSPIPSMAVSTVPDEDSSRGRQPSRWWEQSISEAGSIGRPDRLEKTRRETKYMSVNPATLQCGDEANADSIPGTNGPAAGYGPDEYPQEKVGWHEGADLETPVQTPYRSSERRIFTPGVEPLDVSRLVTLPPPYPRHHPAVNNSHPLLTDLRTEHRVLADHTEIQRIRDAYMEQELRLNREQAESTKQRKAELRANIQSKIANGAMSYADAAKAEADFNAEEAERGKATARSNFNVFEGSVSHPLNTLLTERLHKADGCIQRLQTGLDNGARSADLDRAQEEGDEHPERLEKLTLLKWMFEAREHLHKEMFDLHAMRSDKYSEVILTPYRISKAQAKIDEATAFFKKDVTERQVTFARDSVKRFEELQMIMERNVSRGVEDQLSAFWDIAPGLLEILQQIPLRVDGLDIQIPVQEYDENPSYQGHPLQYLHSLLNHAEKSAYQFIESQTNLLCLLHEVRTATTKARLRLLEIERSAASPNEGEIRAEMVQARREAEEKLTQDLKEKVGEVERQWQEALGYSLTDAKERVSIFLEETGGLEEEFDE